MNHKKIILSVLILALAAALSCALGQSEGEAPSLMGGARSTGGSVLMDVHGAGAQRSDPKSGDPADYEGGRGPQGDVVRILNYVRPVRTVSANADQLSYPIVDTGQDTFFDNQKEMGAPSAGSAFFGQDAAYEGFSPEYRDNGDGTVSDLVTGLMWQQDPGEKMDWDEAQQALAQINRQGLAGYTDWRLPSIKELYSLILFSGRDVSPEANPEGVDTIPFIDTDYFGFSYGNEEDGDRIIDAQYLSSTQYVSTTMGGNETVFGVNFADGRIKGYPLSSPREAKKFFVLFVRGNSEYGKNQFTDNGDGTVTDKATGLMWLQDDQGGMNWEEALAWCEELNAAGYDDWRLPNAKELQSLVDYSRSPDTSGGPAIDPVFSCTAITNAAGVEDYPFYWSSTTHASSDDRLAGKAAAYVSFGRALGWMSEGPQQGSSFPQGPSSHQGPPPRQGGNNPPPRR